MDKHVLEGLQQHISNHDWTSEIVGRHPIFYSGAPTSAAHDPNLRSRTGSRAEALVHMAREFDPSAQMPRDLSELRALEQQCLTQADEPGARRIMLDQTVVGRQIAALEQASNQSAARQGRSLNTDEKAAIKDLWKAASEQYAKAADLNRQALNITPMSFDKDARESGIFSRTEFDHLGANFSNEAIHPDDSRFDRWPHHPRDDDGELTRH